MKFNNKKISKMIFHIINRTNKLVSANSMLSNYKLAKKKRIKASNHSRTKDSPSSKITANHFKTCLIQLPIMRKSRL